MLSIVIDAVEVVLVCFCVRVLVVGSNIGMKDSIGIRFGFYHLLQVDLRLVLYSRLCQTVQTSRHLASELVSRRLKQ